MQGELMKMNLTNSRQNQTICAKLTWHRQQNGQNEVDI